MKVKIKFTADGKYKHTRAHGIFNYVMHQSIPAVPIPPPPPGNHGAFAQVVSPGGGAFAILSQPGGWALAYPGATPGHLTHVFSN